MGLSRGSKARLTPRMLERFPSDKLFDRLARAVCRAGCLPRKELYESWEMARRIRRYFRGGRVIELTAGHALLSQLLLILDDTSPQAYAIDARLPQSAPKLLAELAADWPRIQSRVTLIEAELQAPLPIEPSSEDLIVAAHACGSLTDRAIDRALEFRARIAVLPCCHELAGAELGGLGGWLDHPLAIDVLRATRLAREGYSVRTFSIDEEITPKNRLLLASPR